MMDDVKDFKAQINKQAEEMKKFATYSANPCIIATSIALSDEKVRNKIVEKLNEGNIPKGHRCLSYTTNWEIMYVYFDFDCPHGVFCFIKPSFAVMVNLISKSIIEPILDPFSPSEVNILKNNLNIENASICSFNDVSEDSKANFLKLAVKKFNNNEASLISYSTDW